MFFELATPDTVTPLMAKYGLQASYGDPENGMIESDMRASLSVANSLDEVISFRSR